MSQLSKRERVEAALQGDTVDRVPVAAWRHFIPEERQADSLARVSLKHFHDFDWDWLKVNPRATYYAEAWGNRYDYDRYDSVLPELIEGPINSPADLDKIQQISPTSGVFDEQLGLVRQIKAGIGGAHFLQTLFSPLSVLALLVARPKHHTVAEAVQAQYDGIRHAIEENPAGVHAALKNIAATLALYGAATVDAGASGLFFAIVRLARQGILTEAEYEEFGRPYDQEVLRAVQGAPFNMLHICGPSVYFDSVIQYPVHAVNWASVGQHNPTVGEAKSRIPQALVGGVDEVQTLQRGTPDNVIQQAQAAIRATARQHFLLTPGCGASEDTPLANLHALRQAANATPVVS
jgi:uroporphyrinogen decarboxylase